MTKKHKYKPIAQAPATRYGRLSARRNRANDTWSFYHLDVNELAWLKAHFKEVQARIMQHSTTPKPRIRDDGEALHGIRSAYMGRIDMLDSAEEAVAALLEILGPLMAKHKRTFED